MAGSSPKYPRVIKHDIEIDFNKSLVGVYTILHVPTSSVYHGSTSDLNRRIGEHESSFRGNKRGNAPLINLVKDNPNVELFFSSTETIEQAKVIEQQRIDATDPEKRLNLCLDTHNTAVGNWKNPEVVKRLLFSKLGNTNGAGWDPTPEQRTQMAKRMEGNQRALGHVHTQDTRDRMSKTKLGIKNSKEHIEKSAAGRTKFNVMVDGIEYLNASKAASALGISRAGVLKRCESVNFPNYKKLMKAD